MRLIYKPIAHVIFRDSGVGDHGPAGIDAILKDHRCGAMCETLEMGAEHFIGEKKQKKQILPRKKTVASKKRSLVESSDEYSD